MTRDPSSYLGRIRNLFQKYPVHEVLRHLPLLAEIFVAAAGGNAGGAVIGALRALGVGKLSERRGEVSKVNGDELAAAIVAQEQLASRVEMLERTNQTLRSEVGNLVSQVSSMSRTILTLESEIQLLRKRNAYLGWGLLTVCLVVCAALAWRFLR